MKTILTVMARQAGHDFRWEKIASRKWDFDYACKSAFHGDTAKLAGLFEEVIEPFSHSTRSAYRTNRQKLREAVVAMTRRAKPSERPDDFNGKILLPKPTA